MLIYKIEDQLLTAEKLILGALKDEEVMQKLTQYRYDCEQLHQAKDLLARVREYQRKEAQDFAHFSIERLKNDRKLAHRTYVKHLSIARDALPNRVGAEYEPKPAADRKSGEAPWIEKAALFYNNIMYSASELMVYGIEKSELEQAKAMIEAVKTASHRMVEEQEALKKLTSERDKAYNELLHWMFKFKAIVQLVLEDEPQKLASLGFALES